ncbi:MAG: antibiotic biosynthesis monooxygenase family protein [Bacteroidota bacterium]
MIKRIVRLTFRPAEVDAFLALFEERKQLIRHFKGCHHLELLRDKHRPNQFFTLSVWEDEAALNAYRHSSLFAETWKNTKAKFEERAAAWTVELAVSTEKE